jgi:hypothetical protein
MKNRCLFCSSPKGLKQLHPELVHWWLFVHSNPIPPIFNNSTLYIMLTCAPVNKLFDKNVLNLQSQNDLAPMIVPIIGSPVSNEVGSLFLLFFPIVYFKVNHKINLFGYPSISNPNYLPNFTSTYLHPTKNPKPRCHSNLVIIFCKRRGALL